jgi:hypothetical protein
MGPTRWRIADMLPVRRDSRHDRVRPAQPLKVRRGRPVIQAGIVTAFAADELEPVDMTAFPLMPGYLGRLAPQHNRPAQHAPALGRLGMMHRGLVPKPPGNVQPVQGSALVHMTRIMRGRQPFGITPGRVMRAGDRSNSI